MIDINYLTKFDEYGSRASAHNKSKKSRQGIDDPIAKETIHPLGFGFANLLFYLFSPTMGKSKA